jgi:uncharacterized protein YceH (UPF0502 family)
MANLYAPAGLRSLGIGDDEYVVAEDGTVEVKDGHVAAACSHGCRHDKPEPAALAEPADDLAGRIGQAEQRIAALEARLSQLDAEGGRRRREPRSEG